MRRWVGLYVDVTAADLRSRSIAYFDFPAKVVATISFEREVGRGVGVAFSPGSFEVDDGELFCAVFYVSPFRLVLFLDINGEVKVIYFHVSHFLVEGVENVELHVIEVLE